MTLHQYSSTPDESVMLAVRDGDIRQLGILFDRYQRRIFGFFFRLTGDRGASEDLLQDVFLRILKHRSTSTNSSCFKTWIYRISKNTGADYFGRNGAHLYMDDDVLERLAGTTMPNDLERVETADLLHRAISKLPIDLREALILSRFEHMKYAEIAEVVGCAPGTVKVRIFRAIKELQKVYFRMTGEQTQWNVHK